MPVKSPRPGDLEPIETASRDEISALQLQRLQWSVRHTYDNVAPYRKRCEEAGVHPDDLKSLADLDGPESVRISRPERCRVCQTGVPTLIRGPAEGRVQLCPPQRPHGGRNLLVHKANSATSLVPDLGRPCNLRGESGSRPLRRRGKRPDRRTASPVR